MIYVYQNPETGEIREISQGSNDLHEFSENGKKWERVFTVPNAASDSKINPWDNRQFIDRTGKMKGSVGDIWDHSKELSQARAEKSGGIDPIQRKFFDNYSKLRKGRKHPNDKR